MKIVCPNCLEVIEINDTSIEKVECPSCKMNVSLNIGYQTFESEFQIRKRRGKKRYLNFDFLGACEEYLSALELKPNDLEVAVKYSLNLLYSQSFDNLKFKEVIDFLDSKDITLDSQNTYTFLGFLDTFLYQIKVYLKETERLKIDDVFINETYFNYYLNSLIQIRDSLNYFENVFSLLKEEDYKHYITSNDKNINEIFTKTKNDINSLLLRTYNVNHLGDVEINEDKMVLLNQNQKDLDLKEIDDLRIIIPNEKVKSITKFLYIGGGSLILISLILIIVGLALNNSLITYLSFIPMGLFLILGLFTFLKIRKERSK